MATKEVTWIGGTVDGKGLICQRCGGDTPLPVPGPIPVVTAAMKAFEKMHRGCKDRGPLPSSGDRLTDWMRSGDVGTSSMTIATVLSGLPIGDRRDAPHDPADFGRCHRLLERFPEWRPRLKEVAAVYPIWAPLVPEWDRLTAIYLRDLKTGQSTELYDEIQRLRGEAKGWPQW